MAVMLMPVPVTSAAAVAELDTPRLAKNARGIRVAEKS